MPDIFISYKKEERVVANLLATRLTEAGYDVWWDDALLAGERFEDEITNVLDQSGLVVVLWSRQSVQSDWVKAEAESARQQKKALPVIIDDLPASKMPLLYRGMHAARLAGWEGEAEHSGWLELTGSIRDRLGRARGPKLTAPEAEAKLEQSIDAAKAIVAAAPDELPAQPRKASPSETVKPAPASRRMSPLRWIALLAVILLLLGAAGTFAYFQMNALSPQDAGSIERCRAWASSGRSDWQTGLPWLDDTTAADCERAAARYPDNGDYSAMLAMARIADETGDRASEAIALAGRATDKGSAWGHYVTGMMYYYGINFAIDYVRAATSLRTAADLGLARAQGRLCLMGIDGSMVLPITITREEIGAYCTKGAAANDSFALFATGYAYETGIDGRVVNAAAAAEYYDRASKLGDDDASVRLGILYHRGYGVTYDLARAVALYQQAADNGNPSGQRSLAVSLELGEGVGQDVNHAAQLYEQASIGRDVPAMLLAAYYGVPQNMTSRQYGDVNLLASANTATGQRIRGELLAFGILRQRDPVTAETEFKSCADTGNSMCQMALGYFYQASLSGTADLPKGAALYEQSAAQGNLFGQYYTGYVLETGAGVPQDAQKALDYYRLAAAQGHLSAISRLQQLGQPLP